MRFPLHSGKFGREWVCLGARCTRTMKKIIVTIPIGAALLLTNCAEQGPNTNRGMATGGLIGTGVGAVVGNQSGRALEGAAIGAAAGALAGGLYGKAKDQEQGNQQ